MVRTELTLRNHEIIEARQSANIGRVFTRT